MLIPPDKISEVFSEKNMIPAGLLGVIIYSVVFATRIDDRTTAQGASIDELKKAQIEYNEKITRVDTNVALIKQKLKIKNDDPR